MKIFQSVADLFSSKNVAAPTPVLQKGTADTPPEDKKEPESQSPLDAFKDFWQTPTNQKADSTVVDFKADPQKLLEAANKIDFAKVITPEQLAAIKEGGDGAAQALAQILQASSSSLYAQNMFAATKIAEKAAADVQANFEKQLPALLRKQGLSEELIKENSALAHPALQPIITAMQEQLATKYPNASSSELLRMAKDYVKEAGKAFVPPETPKGKSDSKANGTDWSKYLNG